MSKLHPDAALAAVTARQHGVFSAGQAIELGLTWRRIHAGAAAGRWVRLHGGVYRIAGAPHTWHTGVLAACFGGDAIASHRSAAVLWGLDGFRLGRVEVTRRQSAVPVGQHLDLRMIFLRARIDGNGLGPHYEVLHIGRAGK